MRDDLARKEPQALQHPLVRYDLEGVQQEVDSGDADRLPSLDRTDEMVGIPDPDTLWKALGCARVVCGRRLGPESGAQVSECLVGAGGVGLSRP